MVGFDLENFLATGIYAYALVFVRLSTTMLMLPALGEPIYPQRIRLAVALALTLVLTPMLMDELPARPPDSPVTLVYHFAVESFVGLFFGFTVRLFHSALSVAGQMIGRAIVLANIFTLPFNDNGAGSIIASFLSLCGVMLIFATNLHHLMIDGFLQTYDILPALAAPDTRVMALITARLAERMFEVAAQLAAPFLALNFVYYVGLGVINRMMPTVPVFFIALPIANLAGIAILVASIGFILTNYSAPMAEWLTTLRL